MFPDTPAKDPWARGRGDMLAIGEGHEDLEAWQSVLETLRVAAGRQNWPHDIDMMACWPGSVRQGTHQDGAFSMLASIEAVDGTVFGDYPEATSARTS